MRSLLTLGLVAGAGYLGWQWFAQRARSGTVAYVGNALDDMRDWRLYESSEAYRIAPASMRMTRVQFMRLWHALPDDIKRELRRSYAMTQAEVAAEVVRNAAFRDALQRATEAWRSHGGGTSGLGNYVRSA